MTDFLAELLIAGRVPHHGESRSGFVLVAMNVLEAVFASPFKGGRETGEYHLGNGVGASDEVRECFDVFGLVDDLREMRLWCSDLLSGHLENLVAVHGTVHHAAMVADWLVACN